LKEENKNQGCPGYHYENIIKIRIEALKKRKGQKA
jgi:hypothetical protein